MWWEHSGKAGLSVSTEVFLHFNNHLAALGRLCVASGLPLSCPVPAAPLGKVSGPLVPSVRGKVTWAKAG